MNRAIMICIIGGIVFTMPAFAAIINIPDDYPTIQQGIDSSSDGDTVLVQPGTYVENVNFNGHNIVLGSLFLTTGDTTFISQTIIDGDSSGTVVTFESGEDSTAVFSGFTIRNGFDYNGGGIYCSGSSPIIRRNYIIANLASNEGGGIHCHNSVARILNNTIHGNRVFPQYSAGGGIHCRLSDVIISNNIISENYTSYLGGGIYCEGGNPIVIYNDINHNSATGSAGGIYCNGNRALIAYNVLYANTAEYLGGGIVCAYDDPTLINNTLTSNSAVETGGIYCWNSDPLILSCICWGDSASGQISEIDTNDESDPNVRYCDIQGGWSGEGNIDLDPLFRDPENGDFHLMSTACGDSYDSPCIDTGSPTLIDSLLDCDWGLGTILSDMGAYGGGDSVRVDIDDPVVDLPDKFALLQNYPNPFNPTTTIRYGLPAQSDVRIEIYNILGQKVATLFDGNKRPGYHTITWQADDYPSGVYFARLEAGTRSENIKMVLLK